MTINFSYIETVVTINKVYSMKVMCIDGESSSLAVKGRASAKKVLNRANLKNANTKLKSLAGYKEREEAKAIVAYYSGTNIGAGFCSAQMPGGDEVAMAGIELIMAMHIFNKIYKFDLKKSLVQGLITAYWGHKSGTIAFKAASKFLTVIPVFGNAVNGIVGGATTAALGSFLIDKAEELDRARKNGKRLEDFLKEMEK